MMNFLDLSAASEEERRLIQEILSDTSVVNFAGPSQLQPEPQQRQPNLTNSVINLDMTSTQPSFAMQPPPPTHVTAYGPPPPPPPPASAHNMAYGPPIIQHFATHYLIPFPSYAPMPYVMPANSMVPRQQVPPPQANQLPNAPMSPGVHALVHSSYQPRSSKLKESPNKIQHNHNQHATQMLTSKPSDSRIEFETTSDEPQEASLESSNPAQDFSIKSQTTTDATTTTTTSTSHVRQEKPSKTTNPINEVNGNEEYRVKAPSDEGFDTQSSPEVSKKSTHECPVPPNDKSKPQRENCNNRMIEKLVEKPELPEPNKVEVDKLEKGQSSTQEKAPGPWSSAAKSWASLFKGSIHATSSAVNGESRPNNVNEVNNSGDDIKVSFKVPETTESSSNISNSTSKGQRSQEVSRRAMDKMAPELAQKISSIKLKHSLPLLRPRGFINRGNGCYINSTLQALIACPPFYNLIKEIRDLNSLKRENSCTPILDSFAELFLHFPPLENKKNKSPGSSEPKLELNYLQAEAIEPKCIYNVLGHIKFECLRGAQEDAEEFLSSVLNGLHEEMIGLSETLQYNSAKQNGHLSDEEIKANSNGDENLWREVGHKNRSLPIRTATVINSPIQEIFGGSLFSIRTAGKDRCGHRSPFFDLQLDISSDNVKSLQDAIKSFTATEIIQDFYCSKTKQKLDAHRQTSLDQLPPILILHLKQFVYSQDHGLKKLMKKIVFPIDFELPESCLHDKNSDKGLKHRTYKLLAVVYHEGKEAVKGHYLTDVYHIGSGQWIRCDDSNLKFVPSPKIENPDSSRTPYLLFYRQLKTLRLQPTNSHDNKKRS